MTGTPSPANFDDLDGGFPLDLDPSLTRVLAYAAWACEHLADMYRTASRLTPQPLDALTQPPDARLPQLRTAARQHIRWHPGLHRATHDLLVALREIAPEAARDAGLALVAQGVTALPPADLALLSARWRAAGLEFPTHDRVV